MLYNSPCVIPAFFKNQSVFVAGGISNCPDWQSDIVTNCMNTEKYDIVNPRRSTGFDNTGLTAREQITWEHMALSKVDSCIFWFPQETLCPITLFEFGKFLIKAKQHSVSLIVGWHQNYQRAFDLEVQIQLENVPADYLTCVGSGWEKFTDAVKKTWG